MGIFSVYTGLIYNDVFSKSLNIFGSSWKVNVTRGEVKTESEFFLNPATDSYIGSPYAFGLDPVWQVSTNKIIFQNAYKMKISIIFGVIHMLFGISMSFFNYR